MADNVKTIATPQGYTEVPGIVWKEDTTETGTAFGKKLDTPIQYSYRWPEYVDFPALQRAGKVYSEQEQVEGRNTDSKLSARNKAMNEALKTAGHEKPDISNSNLKRYQEMFKIFMATGEHTPESARATTEAAFKAPWPSDE